jgi:hypothetical protein
MHLPSSLGFLFRKSPFLPAPPIDVAVVALCRSLRSRSSYLPRTRSTRTACFPDGYRTRSEPSLSTPRLRCHRNLRLPLPLMLPLRRTRLILPHHLLPLPHILPRDPRARFNRKQNPQNQPSRWSPWSLSSPSPPALHGNHLRRLKYRPPQPRQSLWLPRIILQPRT